MGTPSESWLQSKTFTAEVSGLAALWDFNAKAGIWTPGLVQIGTLALAASVSAIGACNWHLNAGANLIAEAEHWVNRQTVTTVV